MAVVDSSIAVPVVAAVAALVDNVSVTTGVGLVNRQGIVPSDPENPNARQAVLSTRPATNRYGSVVRQAPALADSGNQLLTTSPASAYGSTVSGVGVLLVNLTDQIQKVTVTDGNDLPYLQEYPLAPRKTEWIPLGGVDLANGVKWFAGGNNAVRAQFKGDA